MRIEYSFFQIESGTTEFHTEEYQYWIILSNAGEFYSNKDTFFLYTHDVLEIPEKKEFSIECRETLQIGCIKLFQFETNNHTFQKKEAADCELLRKVFFFSMEVRGLSTEGNTRFGELVDQMMYESLLFSGLRTYRVNPGIAAAIRELNQHIYEPDYDIQGAVLASGYSQSYFHKLFHETTGHSPVSYINKQRMDHAKVLLRQSDRPSIKEIAVQCGFPDAYYFSRIFRKYNGMSPSEYSRISG